MGSWCPFKVLSACVADRQVSTAELTLACADSPDGAKIVFLGPLDDRYTMYSNGTHLTRIVTDQPGGLSDWGASP